MQPESTPVERIRNFSIIAHIDHGKSTLADRILEFTGAVTAREMRDQILDKMELERERGITIKAQSVRLFYRAKDGLTYQLQLIDTPGHVDFNYEVSRSLAACEGALLVVDASQGIQAQTLANVYLALENNLEIIPVLNKADLPNADPERVKKEIEDVIGLDTTHHVLASAKTGLGIEDILEKIVTLIPPPQALEKEPLQALIFDSWFDAYLGVVLLVRVKSGAVKKGERVLMMYTGKSYEVLQLGYFSPTAKACTHLNTGEVGFVVLGIKDIRESKIGDTMTHEKRPTQAALQGFQEVKPTVFAGIYPVDASDYENLKVALEKLQLNDAALHFEPETSQALGFGFRCGFLGLLHMEVVQERLEREYDLTLIMTLPSVVYRVTLTNGTSLWVDNPSKLPETTLIETIEEPYVRSTLYVPKEYVGQLIQLCQEKRGEQIKIEYVSTERVCLVYELPWAEIIYDFYDALKSLSRGYASFDYEMIGYRVSSVKRLDVLVNTERVDALSMIVHADKAYYAGRELCERLKETIHRQQYEVAIQAAIGGKIIARSTVKAVRKDVTAKCYGGDITRKRKLLEKQKEGKKRMKQVGSIEIPQEAFLAVLKRE